MILAVGGRRRVSLALADPPYSIPTSRPYNVPQYLTTPTYDGSGMAVHPDVIDTGRGRWGGWRFWMAMTPYPYNNDSLENPSLLVSDDAVTWQVPDGLTNPIWPTPATMWNSDPDIVYDPDSGEMVVLFRDNYSLRVARSSDGATWNVGQAAFQQVPVGSMVSPSIVREADGTWTMWGVSNDTSGGKRLGYRWKSASLEGPWTNVTVCTGLTTWAWHPNVMRYGDGYLMVLAHDNGSPDTAIYALSSSDGLAWTANPSPIIPKGAGGSWDDAKMYRSAFSLHENGTHMRVWYCGDSSGSGNWHIGLTHVPLTEWPAIP